MLSLKASKTNGYGPERRIVRHYEWPDQVIPLIQELQKKQRQQRRTQQRDHDLQEYPRLTRAINPGSIKKLAWNPKRKLAHEEHAERAHHQRDDQRLIGA